MHASKVVTINASVMAKIMPVRATPGGTDNKVTARYL